VDVIARVALVAGIVIAAGLVAALLERRRVRRPAPAPVSESAPRQVDRADFARPTASWLVLLFSSQSCESCAAMAERIVPLESDAVAVDEVDYAGRRDLHEKYRIEAVPVVGVYDALGVARFRFAGPVPAEHIWSAVHALSARSTT
jgi:thioredoxin-related protein